MDDSVKVDGLDELKRALEALPANIERNLMRGALRAGQKVFQTAAKQSTAFADHTGALRKSIRISTSARRGIIKATLKAGNKVAYYAHMVEFGTAAHVIEAQPGHALSVGGNEFARVHHPGAKKRPFMRPALDTKAREAIDAVADYLRTRIESEQAAVPGPDNY